ncbi:MAG: tetratricopeptide repeat protein [Planctomycetota bacterium]
MDYSDYDESNDDFREDDSKSGFMSFDDSQEIESKDLAKRKDSGKVEPPRPKPPVPKPPKPAQPSEPPRPPEDFQLSTERKKSSEDFSYNLDFGAKETARLRKEAIERRKAEKRKAEQPPKSDLMSAPLMSESPHGKPERPPRPKTQRRGPSFEIRPNPDDLGDMPPPPRTGDSRPSPAIALDGETKAPGAPAAAAAAPPRGVTGPVTETRTKMRIGAPLRAETSWFMYVLLILLLGFAAVVSYRYICNFDVWWHITTGSDILASKALPGNDAYSYTASGKTVFTPYPLSQVVLALLNGAGGARAIIILKTALVALALLICVLAAPGKRLVGIVALWLALAALFAANARLLARPHLISLVLAPLYFLILARHERWSTKWIWVLPFTTIIWANWHPSWIIGIMLVFAFLVGNAIFFFYGISYDERKREKKRIGWLALIFVLVAAAGLATPNHINGFLHPIRQLATLDVNIGVGEWTSPVKGFTFLSTHLLFWKILAAVGVLSFLLNWKQQRLSHLLIFIGTLLLSLTAYRHIALFAILAAPIAAGNIGAFLDRLDLESVGRFTAAAFGIIFAGVIAYCGIAIYHNDYYRERKLFEFHTGTGVSSVHLPVEAVEKFSALGLKGNGFHNYHLGGYLMYKLGPAVKVFLDGRLLHYPKSVRDDYRALKTEPATWTEIAAKPEYSFEWAMLAHTTGEMMGLIKYLWENAEWRLVHVDSVVTVFVKKSGLNAELAEKTELESLGKVRSYGKQEYEAFHYRQIGRLWTVLGKFDWATAYLEKAEKKPYASRDAQIDLGMVALLSGDTARAKMIFESIYPKSFRVYIGLGEAELESQPPVTESARRYFQRATELNPSAIEAWNGLAKTAMAEGNQPEAKTYIDKALELDPDSAETLKLHRILLDNKE